MLSSNFCSGRQKGSTTGKMEIDIFLYSFHIVVCISLGFFIVLRIYGYNRFQCRKDSERSFEEPIDNSYDFKEIEMKPMEEIISRATVCACKPGDYPRCLLEC